MAAILKSLLPALQDVQDASERHAIADELAELMGVSSEERFSFAVAKFIHRIVQQRPEHREGLYRLSRCPAPALAVGSGEGGGTKDELGLDEF